MTRANLIPLGWPPPPNAEPVDTLAIPSGSGEGGYAYVIISQEATEDASLIQEQDRSDGMTGEKLLADAVDKIRWLAPLEVDSKTQSLLDAAIEEQDTGLCDDLEGWASRLANDVKDAGD